MSAVNPVVKLNGFVYVITGVDRSGKRVPARTTSNPVHAQGWFTGIYSGTLWTLNPETGKRTRLAHKPN